MNNAFLKKKPKEIDAAVWEIVVEAWENGLSDKEAAFRVEKLLGTDLSADDIRQWCKDFPHVGELRANLLCSLLSDAKLNIAQDMRDPNSKERMKTSRWYLERKAADEFSTKSAIAFEGAVVELSLEDKEKKLKELVEQFEGGE